jgi:CYTH domain-containing protein
MTMGVEIERKFLVDASSFTPPEVGSEIRQGYLARDADRSVRVRLTRRTTSEGTVESATLTIKGPDGMTRAEYEYPIPPGDAVELLDTLSLPGEISKTRYKVDVAGRPFEVDVYSGRHAGLLTAEVELDSESDEVVLPDWVTEEVTGDPAWTNAAMSRIDDDPRGAAG